MNITREDMPGRQVALTIELEAETVNTALERAYRQMVNQVDIPGFRRGKAPRYILERYVGIDMLTERAVKNILPQTLQDAIAEQNIEAMDVGDVEIVSMDPVQVKVIVVQPPLIELGDYSTIRVEKEKVEITPEQIEEVIAELRRESAPWNEPSEPRPIAEGDMVYLNLEGFTGEGELEEAQRDNFPTIVGAEHGGVPQVVNEALAGMSIGEEKDIVATLPEDYPTESLRGRDVTYHVTTLSMKEQQLPEVNEEFTKGLGFDTVEAMREAIERNLKERAEDNAQSGQVNSAVAQMVEMSSVEVPDMLVKEELDSMLKNLEERLKGSRLSLRQYFSFNGISEDEWREANTQRARDRIVRSLVLQEFARREGVSVDDTEVEGEIEQMLERFEGQEKETARSVLAKGEAKEDLQDRLYQRKILDRLTGIVEGTIEAAPAPTASATEAGEAGEGAEGAEGAEAAEESPTGETAGDEAASEQTEEAGAGESEEASGTASDLESAGGAAEVLGTGGIDIHSENETGEAQEGGTPSSAPALES
ncbi:MAG: trigger factor [Chloroflexia bacterium]